MHVEGGPGPPDLLEHITVELLLPVSQELTDHLAAEALALQQKVGHPHWCVGHEAALNEILDALFRLPGWDGQEECLVMTAQPLEHGEQGRRWVF